VLVVFIFLVTAVCFRVDHHVCVVRNILAADFSDELHVVYSVYEKVEPPGSRFFRRTACGI